MSSFVLALRYAEALYRIAKEKNNVDRVSEDIKMIDSFLNSSDEFVEFLKTKSLSSEKRQAIIKSIFVGKISQLTLVCLFFLEHKGRLDILDYICQAFEKVHLNEENTLHVKVATAIKMNDSQIIQLKKQLTKKYEKNIVTELSIEPKLIGGLKMQVGDFLHDHSIRGQLDRFKQQSIHTR